MPTYDYQCQKCGVAFELVQPFSEDALKKCPTKKSGNSPAACVAPGRGKVVKVFSAPGIAFKGSGFYKNDSRKKPPSKTSKSSDSADKSSSSSSSTSSSDSSSSSGEKKTSESSSAKSDKSPSKTSTGSS